MRIEVVRRWLKEDYTIGLLLVNGKVFCDTLEDKDRMLSNDMPLEYIQSKKIKGKTSIPIGTYSVEMTYSPKFKKKLPLINGIKGFSGVRIHAGNTAEDTEGCILVGYNLQRGRVDDSRKCLNALLKEIEKALKNDEEIILDVHH